jgi:hypothetical protein
MADINKEEAPKKEVKKEEAPKKKPEAQKKGEHWGVLSFPGW